MQNYFEINTRRLFLRTLTENDSAVVRDFNKDEFATDDDALEWIRWVNENSDMSKPRLMFYIWLAETCQPIGRVYIHSKPELNGEVEIGYGISEEYRNKGYATEAAEAIVRFAFERAGQQTLCAIIKPENTASRHVIKKLGFEYCGVRTVMDSGENCEFDYFKLCSNVSQIPNT